MGPLSGLLGESFIAADWRVRVFGSSHFVDRPYERLYVCIIPLSGCMLRHFFIEYKVRCTFGTEVKQKDSKRLHVEPGVCTSDYYFSNIGEVLRLTFLRRSMTINIIECSLNIYF